VEGRKRRKERRDRNPETGLYFSKEHQTQRAVLVVLLWSKQGWGFNTLSLAQAGMPNNTTSQR
jgi:hypothetical protein